MRNKWLILLIFIVAGTLFLSVDFSKIKVNGNTEDNYNTYYEVFEGTAFNTTAGVVKNAVNTLTGITNTFENIWGFILKITGNSGETLTNMTDTQGQAKVSIVEIFGNRWNGTRAFHLGVGVSNCSQVVIIGANYFEGAYPKAYFWGKIAENRRFIQFNYSARTSTYNNDYSITVFDTSNGFETLMRRGDPLNDGDLDFIILPLETSCSYDDIMQTFKSLCVYGDFSATKENLLKVGLRFWFVHDVDDATIGNVGEWIIN